MAASSSSSSTSWPGGQVVAILQQQPARAFDHAPATAVGTQLVGPIDPHPVDDLAAVLGHDVEQVEHDGRVRAVRLHLAFIASVHVHDGRLQGLTARRAEQLEERPDVLAAPAAADPQHALAHRLHDHGGVAVALLDRKLVQRDDPHAVQIDRSQLLLQAGVVAAP